MKNIFNSCVVILCAVLITGCDGRVENPSTPPEPFVTSTLDFRTIPTPLPTLSPDIARQEVFELLQEDAECKFPCFWGLVPGETAFADALNKLNSYSALGFLLNSTDDTGGMNIKIPLDDGEKIIRITFTIEGNDNILSWQVVNIALEMKQDPEHLWFNNMLLDEIANRLSLPQTLSTYGKPSDIKIFTYSGFPMGATNKFYLLLMYPEQGFMVEYIAPAGVYPQSGKPNQMIGCFADAYVRYIFWKPSKEITIDNVISQTNGSYIYSYMYDQYQSIGKVTDLSLDSFYTKFATADGRQCLLTPQDFWSLP